MTFTVTAAGTAPLSYQWYQGMTPVGDNNPFYIIRSAQPLDAGDYTVTVDNGTAPGARSSAVTLTVRPVVALPAITSFLADQSVVTGSTASFSVAATGSMPLSYQWQLDQVNVGTGLCTYESDPSTSIGRHNVTVTITNAAGSLVSNPAALTVTTAPVAPTISTPPNAKSVTVDDPVTFTVIAAGTAPLSFQWYRGTTAVGDNNPFYTISSAQLTDVGDYTVTVSNATARTATSSAAALTVSPVVVAPIITTYPADQSVVTGSSATFAVAATGSTPLSCQWHLDNVNVGKGLCAFRLILPLASAVIL